MQEVGPKLLRAFFLGGAVIKPHVCPWGEWKWGRTWELALAWTPPDGRWVSGFFCTLL